MSRKHGYQPKTFSMAQRVNSHFEKKKLEIFFLAGKFLFEVAAPPDEQKESIKEEEKKR